MQVSTHTFFLSLFVGTKSLVRRRKDVSLLKRVQARFPHLRAGT
jgi:hypothetical protein